MVSEPVRLAPIRPAAWICGNPAGDRLLDRELSIAAISAGSELNPDGDKGWTKGVRALTILPVWSFKRPILPVRSVGLHAPVPSFSVRGKVV